MSTFNAESTTHDVIEGISLQGKLAVVTGASSGLGVETVRVLAGAGARVIMTELSRHMVPDDFEMLKARQPEGREMVLKSVPQGAATSVWGATSPSLAGEGGIYLEDCHIAEAATPGGDGGVESYALDHADADRLWAVSEELVGQVFNF